MQPTIGTRRQKPKSMLKRLTKRYSLEMVANVSHNRSDTRSPTAPRASFLTTYKVAHRREPVPPLLADRHLDHGPKTPSFPRRSCSCAYHYRTSISVRVCVSPSMVCPLNFLESLDSKMTQTLGAMEGMYLDLSIPMATHFFFLFLLDFPSKRQSVSSLS